MFLMGGFGGFYVSVPGDMSSDTAKKLAMVYLFLSAEHRINDFEYSLFETIGASYKGFDEAKGAIAAKCEELLVQENAGKSRFDAAADTLPLIPLTFGASYKGLSAVGAIAAKREEVLVQENAGKSRFDVVADTFAKVVSSYSSYSKTDQYEVLLLLVNLLYEPNLDSESRRKLLDLWVSKGGIDNTVVVEMRDTVETLRDLAEHRKWVEAGGGLGPVRDIMIEELEKNQREIQESVSDLIALR